MAKSSVTGYTILHEHLLRRCFCPCCEGVESCEEDCTYAFDMPIGFELLQEHREALRTAKDLEVNCG